MIHAWLAVLYGVTLSLANTLNAQLSSVYGNGGSTLMIHIAGLIVLLPLAFRLCRRKGTAPWYTYGGGFIGIGTVVCCNLGIAGVGVTANLVLMLLGQLISSAVIDHFGFFGARIMRFTRMKLIALLIMTAGCVAMLMLSGDSATLGGVSVALAILMSFLSGVTSVFSRICNAHLATHAGVGYSTLMNYLTGFAGSIVLFAIMGFHLNTAFPAPDQSILIYVGGAVGTIGIFLCNTVTPKLPTMQMSILCFVGQVFSGMLIDGLMGRFSLGTLLGGLLVAVGLYVNTLADAKEAGRVGNAVKPEES